jgi:hypothetical protein
MVMVMVGFGILFEQNCKKKKVILKRNSTKTNDKNFMKIFPSLDDEEDNKDF